MHTEVTGFTVMGKWKLANVYKREHELSKCLKLRQDGTNREMCAKEVCGKIKILYCNVCGTFNVVMIYHLIFLWP
jgi:hypothetical protein